MSIVNWNLSPVRVELVTDTLAYDGSYHGLWNTTKFFTVPHARLIIADTGPAVAAFDLQKRAMSCDLDRGIDDFAVLAPEWLLQIQADFLEEHGEQIDRDQNQHLWNVAAFGYSEERRRVLGMIFNAAHEFQSEGIADGDAFNPPLTEEFVDRSDPAVQKVLRQHSRELTRFKSPDSFIAGAKLQQIAAVRTFGGGIGGDLLMATLTKDRLEVRRIGKLPKADAEELEVRDAIVA